MKGLTKRQREIVDFIESFIAEYNFSPSYREIMRHFNFSSLGSVYKHISVLKRKGVLSAEKNSARSMTLSEADSSAHTIDLPFLGQIAAGKPIEMFPQAGTITVPASLAGDKAKSFVLQVRGDSMGPQVLNSDLIIIEKREVASPGETIVALIDGHEATLKRYQPKEDQIELHSINPNFPVITLAPHRLHIEGVLRGLIRKY